MKLQIFILGVLLMIPISYAITFSYDGGLLNLDGYYNSESNLTGLLDNNYVEITGDTMTGNLTVPWFFGNYDWVTSDDWQTFNGHMLTFNESKLSASYLEPSSFKVERGTLVSGSIENVSHIDGNYDSNSINISEIVAAPALDVRFNFTNVTTFNNIILRINTLDHGKSIFLYMYEPDDFEWELYGEITATNGYQVFTYGVYDPSSHINDDGVVQIRIYQPENGNTNHDFYFDWVSLSQGFSVPAPSETDPFSIHKTGDTELTGDWDVGGKNITNINYLGVNNLTIDNGFLNGGVSIYNGSGFFSEDLFIGGDIITIDSGLINGSIFVNTDNYYTIGNNTHKFKTVYSYQILTDTINTGLGAYEVYKMNQNVASNDNVTFDTLKLNLTHGTGSSLVTLIDFGSGEISANSTHICLSSGGKICVEKS